MIKLAILGSENSHAWGFSSVFAPKDGKKMFEDVELIGMHLNPETEDAEHNGGHYGLAADGKLTEADFAQAELFGKHVANVVKRVTA